MVGHCFLVVYATAFFRPTATGPQLLNITIILDHRSEGRRRTFSTFLQVAASWCLTGELKPVVRRA